MDCEGGARRLECSWRGCRHGWGGVLARQVAGGLYLNFPEGGVESGGRGRSKRSSGVKRRRTDRSAKRKAEGRRRGGRGCTPARAARRARRLRACSRGGALDDGGDAFPRTAWRCAKVERSQRTTWRREASVGHATIIWGSAVSFTVLAEGDRLPSQSSAVHCRPSPVLPSRSRLSMLTPRRRNALGCQARSLSVSNPVSFTGSGRNRPGSSTQAGAS